MTLHNKSVLICGASIAGPTLAHWLTKYGFEVTVVEQAPELRTGGQPIDVRAAAIDVLDRTGVLDNVHAAQTTMHGVRAVNARNRDVAVLRMEAIEPPSDARYIELMRGELARILYGCTDGVEYVFGDTIAALEQRADDVLVRFERAEPRAFDLVIGADGLHSTVRSLAFGPEDRYRDDLGYYLSTFSLDDDLGRDFWTRIYNEPGRLAGIYPAQHDWMAKAILAFRSEPLRYDYRDPDQQQRIIIEEFRDASWKVSRLLSDMTKATDFYFDSMSQIRMERWSSGRVALVGDAAWCPSPLTGQGTSMAVVGAYVLAGELAEAEGDHRTAFRRYHSRLRDYVRENQRLVSAFGPAFIPRTAWGLAVRQQGVRLLPYLAALNPLRGLDRSNDRLRLPDYVARQSC